LEKLKTAPSDEAANLALGSYYCLRLRRWETGLPFLARGSDKKMRDLAAVELAGINDGEKALQTADAWWDYADAKGTPAADATAIKLHAAGLYEKG
jgi:hypothetical protein